MCTKPEITTTVATPETTSVGTTTTKTVQTTTYKTPRKVTTPGTTTSEAWTTTSESYTTRPEQTYPETTRPEQTYPETTRPESTYPETTRPERTYPETTRPEKTYPETTRPEKTYPETTRPETETTAPEYTTSEPIVTTQCKKRVYGCSFRCEETCHCYRNKITQCIRGDRSSCVPTCGECPQCPPGYLRKDQYHCIKPTECDCITDGGVVVKAGETKEIDDCTVCRCYNNKLVCSNFCTTSSVTTTKMVETTGYQPTVTTTSETYTTKPETYTTKPETYTTTVPETYTTRPETDTTTYKTPRKVTTPSTTTTPGTWTTEPETYTTKPETYTTKPETYTTRPESYTTKPETYTTRSETYTTKPETYTTKPETYATKPETYTTRPETYTTVVTTTYKTPRKVTTPSSTTEVFTTKPETYTTKPETTITSGVSTTIPQTYTTVTTECAKKVYGCSFRCEETCHCYRYKITQCQRGDRSSCVPTCGECPACPKGYIRKDLYHCVKPTECDCITDGNVVVPAGKTIKVGQCQVCTCYQNTLTCSNLCTTSATTEATATTTTRAITTGYKTPRKVTTPVTTPVTRPTTPTPSVTTNAPTTRCYEEHEVCSWTSWMDACYPTPAVRGDDESFTSLRRHGFKIGGPNQKITRIQCRTVGTHIDYTKTGQNVVANCEVGCVCTHATGPSKFQMMMRGISPYCYNYEVRLLCCNANVAICSKTTTPSTPTTPEKTYPETTRPEVTEPEKTYPETTKPEVTEPEKTYPETTKPEVTEPEKTYPETTKPEVTEPEKTYPETTKPEVTEPETTKPTRKVTTPSTARTTRPDVTEPEKTYPETTKPEVTEPEKTFPETTKPVWTTVPETTKPWYTTELTTACDKKVYGCSFKCEETCHCYRFKITQCMYGDRSTCVPTCGECPPCPKGYIRKDREHCVKPTECPCVTADGTVIPPGQKKQIDECNICECYNNNLRCENFCTTTTPVIVSTTSIVVTTKPEVTTTSTTETTRPEKTYPETTRPETETTTYKTPRKVTTPSTTTPETFTTRPERTYQESTRVVQTYPETTRPERTYQESTRVVQTYPETTRPEQTYPETTRPEKTYPETTKPKKTYPETTRPEKTYPETTRPEKTYPETTRPEKTYPETTKPEKTYPETTRPEKTYPETTRPEKTYPETTRPEKTYPETTRPEQTYPETTRPEKTYPETTRPEKTYPETTRPEKTYPETTRPEKTYPETTKPTRKVTTPGTTTSSETTKPESTEPEKTYPESTTSEWTSTIPETTTSRFTTEVTTQCAKKVYGCSFKCEETCHCYRFKITQFKITQCMYGDRSTCVPTCGECPPCPKGYIRKDRDHCVKPTECPCVTADGTVIPPGEKKQIDECHICDCYNNNLRCENFCTTTTPVVVSTTTIVVTTPTTTTTTGSTAETTRPEKTYPETTKPETETTYKTPRKVTTPSSTTTETFTTRPEQTYPDTTKPERTYPETTRPERTYPETTRPEKTYPETTKPETETTYKTPRKVTTPSSTTTETFTTRPEQTYPETTRPEKTYPETTRPERTYPETTRPEKTYPETTRPEKTYPETTRPERTYPETTSCYDMCHSMRQSVTECKYGHDETCVPQCGYHRKCPKGYCLISSNECVREVDCDCRLENGTVVQPNTKWMEGKCMQCSCEANKMVCRDICQVTTTTPVTEPTATTVTTTTTTAKTTTLATTTTTKTTRPPHEDKCFCYGYGKCGHFVSYDSCHYNFDGRCTYVLTRDMGKQEFEVMTVLDECGFPGTTCPVALIVRYRDCEIKMEAGYKVLSNGKYHQVTSTCPFVYNGIVVERVGFQLVATVKAVGLEAKYDCVNKAFNVLISNFYIGKTEGLCGICNQDKSDDFTLRDGSVTKNVVAFGRDWLVERKSIACNEIKPVTPCPKRDESICNILWTNAFAACHNVVDVMKYYDACLYDECYANNTCSVLAAYAAECRSCGVVLSWRTKKFCQVTTTPQITTTITPTTPPKECFCFGYGECHFSTFDSRSYKYCGRCTHLLSRHNAKNPDYEVYISNEACPNNPSYTCTRSVKVLCGKTQVELMAGFKVIIDGSARRVPRGVTIPINNGAMTVRCVGLRLILNYERYGLEVQYDDSCHGFSVTVPNDRYGSNTEGLCGVCNGQYKVNDFNKFGRSWFIDDGAKHCQTLPPPTPTCSPVQTSVCDILHSSVFAPCHSYVNVKSFKGQLRAHQHSSMTHVVLDAPRPVRTLPTTRRRWQDAVAIHVLRVVAALKERFLTESIV
ncbi:PREDICTED: mucin-2-like [Branchiostoma belcheri]|uniref:Mucin-2-like n=1 Tax=Branchiostoma belcheri TaxID=7741 RepID=A0A6P4XQI3_BRABE|nr:PREDICTED: mucin-2-like [Branchiostoma belcheri]